MAKKFVCQRCAYTVVLEIGRYIICPKCSGAMASFVELTTSDTPPPEVHKDQTEPHDQKV